MKRTNSWEYRRRKIVLLASVSVCAVAIAGGAVAQNTQINFSIGTQSLSGALLDYGKQAGLSIAASGNLVNGRQAPLVSGAFSQADALHVLLKGSGLDFEFTSANSVRIYEPADKPVIRVADQVAQADQPAASAGSGLEEVVVTARRKEEKAQSVPIAITNISAQNLEEQHIVAPLDIFKETTGFNAVGGTSAAGRAVAGGLTNSYMWIRGVPGVVPYWNDVPAIILPGLLFDTASIQVLKGPQGTLFGQATNGGAVIFQPRLPTGSFEGYVEAEAGDYGHSSFEGAVNVPIIPDKLLIRASFKKHHTDGYVFDVYHKEWDGSQDWWDGRLGVTFRPTDAIQNDTMVNYYSFGDTGGPTLSGVGQIRAVNTPVFATIYPSPTCTTAACLITYGGPLGWYAVPGNPYFPSGMWESGNNTNITNTTRWDISDSLTVKNILGYLEALTGYSVQTLPYPLSPFPPTGYNKPTGPGKQATEELQFLGKLFDDKLSYTGGAFLLWNQGSTGPHNVQYSCSGSVMAPRCSGSVLYSGTRTEAVYAQGTYDFGDLLEGLSFTAGYRYTWDRPYASTFTYTAAGVAAAGWSDKTRSSAGSYTLSLDWQIDPKTMLYITDSKGYSRGGLTPTVTLPPAGRVYKPENLDNVEFGVKADFDLPADMKARTNVSLFYGFYDNVQTSNLVNLLDALGNPTSAVLTSNAAQAHIDGLDFDLTLLPVEGVQISGGAVWAQYKYDKYPYGNPPQDFTPSVFLLDPKWTWHIRVSYELPIDPSLGKATISANLTHVGPYWGTVGFPYETALNMVPANNNLDMSLSWSEFLGRPDLDMRAYVTNVTNKHFSTNTNSTYSSGYFLMGVAPPRMWGVSLKYSFGS